MDDCILVKGITSELAEVELEEDGTVSLEALRCHFGPLVVSMKYTNETTGLDRFVRVSDGHFLPPKDGWGSRMYKTISREERDGSNRPRAPDSLYQHPLIKLEPNLSGGAEVESESRPTQDLEVKAESVPELTKNQVQMRMKTSAVARTAVYQWNRMNTALRVLVHQTTFHGSAGMLKCEGTTKEEAQENQKLRELISSHDSVRRLFGVFYMEDRSGKITLDQFKALQHVRHVLNEVRRIRPSKPAEIVQSPDPEVVDKPVDYTSTLRDKGNMITNTRARTGKSGTGDSKRKASKTMNDKENKSKRARNEDGGDDTCEYERDIEPVDDTSTLTDKGNMITNTRARTGKSGTGDSKRKASKTMNDKENKRARNEEDDDGGDIDDRSEYERDIEVTRHENQVFQHQLGLTGKPKLSDADAVVVARSRFPVQQKVTNELLEQQADEFALEQLPVGKLRVALIHFGHELVENNCVTLKRPAGLVRTDVLRCID